MADWEYILLGVFIASMALAGLISLLFYSGPPPEPRTEEEKDNDFEKRIW